MKVIFWLAVFIIVYVYIGYTILLYLVTLFKRASSEETKSFDWPTVTLLISAYNEEETIEDKIANSLDLNYPLNRLEIIVVSDGSIDKTNQIVSGFKNKGVILKHYDGRIGKTACLNKTVPLVKGDIIIFSDANSLYHKEALKRIVIKFANKNIGCVTGHTRYVLRNKNSELVSVGFYSKMETLTKKLESKIGSCIGADGAIFAIRKSLYHPLDEHAINDFVIPLLVVKEKFRVICEDKAFCYEKTARDQKGEFDRQVRITNRTLRAIFHHRELLNPLNYPMFSFKLISHKLLKFYVPFLLVVIIISNILLIIDNGVHIYKFTFIAQIIFYLTGWASIRRIYIKSLSKLGALCGTFTLVNIAILKAWFKYLQGETFTSWTPNR
jgi:cellulose synthase/poly-beta-1,6-N-acetylglucosamine synthase-like glycosyltransferase